MMPLWVSDLAEQFWKAAGEPEAYPRNLRRPIAYALPLSLVTLPRLGLVTADTWLRRQGISCGMARLDRALRACLVARDGGGFIFVDGTDPEDEQRFSIAHELAHFLRDYWQPRQVAVERLGPHVLAVLDGKRRPSQDERIQALLARAPLGLHLHLLDRAADGGIPDAATDRAERNADLLAFELLAPAEAVLADARSSAADRKTETIARCLGATFGFPATQAKRYAALLSPPVNPDPLLRRLKLIPPHVELFEVGGK